MSVWKDPATPVGIDGVGLVTTLPLRWTPWVTPVLDTSAYSAGDALHVALLRLPEILKAPNYQTTLVGMIVEDSTATPQNIGMTAWFFDRPEVTTPALNAAWTLTAPDREKRVACASSGPYNTSTATGVSENFSLLVPLYSRSQDTDLWVLLQTLGAPTYTASSVRLRFVVRD